MNPASDGAFPKNFKLVTVFAIMIGILGILAGLTGAASVLTGAKTVANAFSIPNPDPQIQEMQERMMSESAALADTMRVPTGIMAVCNLLISSVMLAGGLLTSRVRRDGRKLLLNVLLVSLIYDPLALIPTIYITVKTMAFQSELSKEMVATISKNSSNSGTAEMMETVMGTAMTVSMYMGVAFALGWVGVKIWFYVWARKRLTQPDVTEFFALHGR